MANVFVSVPILDRPETKFIISLYSAILSSRNHKIRIYVNESDSLISRVRNSHITAFYNEFKNYDYFMSFDSDLCIINSLRDNNIFDRLIDHDLDFVGGLYALKNPKSVKCSSIMEDGGNVPSFNSGLKQVRWLSSGCWCIKRAAIDKMVNAYPELQYDGDDNMAGKKLYGLYVPFIFEAKPNEFSTDPKPFRKYLSEDWAFCERWRKIGGKIYADSGIILEHIGKASYPLYTPEDVAAGLVTDNVVNKPPEPGHNLKT